MKCLGTAPTVENSPLLTQISLAFLPNTLFGSCSFLFDCTRIELSRKIRALPCRKYPISANSRLICLYCNLNLPIGSCRYYYDALMKPNSRSVLTALKKIANLPYTTIAVGHGPVLRFNIPTLVEK